MAVFLNVFSCGVCWDFLVVVFVCLFNVHVSVLFNGQGTLKTSHLSEANFSPLKRKKKKDGVVIAKGKQVVFYPVPLGK